MLNTPVVLIIFNRPDITGRIFAEIRRARPKTLFIVADGPRNDRHGERELCARTRAIVEQVNWPCEVLKNYSDTNMGCGKRPATGISWVFEQVEEAIILEDDCLPHPTFFRYCEELLAKYRDDERIMVVSGDNFQFGRKRTSYSYYFSIFPHCNGWASWRRAWRHFDFEISLLPEVLDSGSLRSIHSDRALRYWSKIFKNVYESNEKHFWDYQWAFACWIQNGLAILPDVNLVTNIGYGSDATHTTDSNCHIANLPVEAMNFPLTHPKLVLRNYQADKFTQDAVFPEGSLVNTMKKFKKFLGM